MNFQISIPLLALFLLAKCENTIVKNLTADTNDNEIENSTPEPASLCTMCACTGSRNVKILLFEILFHMTFNNIIFHLMRFK